MSDPLIQLRQARARADLLRMSDAARAVVEAGPPLGGAWAEVVSLAIEAGDEVAAVLAGEKLVAEAPQHRESWSWLATAQAALGHEADALKTLERALAREPEHPGLNRRAGRLLLDLGRRREAEVRFGASLAREPNSATGWEGLVDARRFSAEDELLVQLEQLRVNLDANTPATERGIVSYALARAYEDMGEYEVSARRVSEAAAFYREGAPFDIDHHEAAVAHLLRTYDQSFASANAEAGLLDARPVFLLAPPRSGASWLSRVLVAGEDAVALPRRNALFWMAGAPLGDHTREELHKAMEASPGEGVLAEVARTYLTRLRERVGRAPRRVIDAGGVNELAGGAIGLALPAARFIVVTREPRDLAWAIYKHRFRRARHWTYHPDDIARILACHRALMARWAEIFPERVLFVSYEELSRDPENEVRRAAFFAGVDADAAATEAWMRRDELSADPPGVHGRAGDRFAPLEQALERAGLA